MTFFKKSIFTLFAFVVAMGCTQQQSHEKEVEKNVEPATNFEDAVAVVHPTEGSDVTGTVHFQKVENGVQVTGEFEGLNPGNHGFHIHQYGDCTAGDGTSAGGHYNPTENEHSGPTDEVRHMGDMGNIEAGEDGTASVDYVDSKIELNGANSIIGRGVIIHGGEDDFTSQPSGAAGPRKACGVIGVANTGM